MATEAQIKANLKNTLSSSGPATPEGKEISRRNSCKHGLAGSGVVVAPADRAKAEARALAFREEFRPETEFERTLVEQMAADSVRLDRCRETYFELCEQQITRDPSAGTRTAAPRRRKSPPVWAGTRPEPGVGWSRLGMGAKS